MKINTMQDLFNDLLFDAYHAEKQLVKALPRKIQKANHKRLEQAFTDHLVETKKHVQRIEEVMDMLNIQEKTETCEAMQGLIEEAGEFMEELREGNLLDVALIAAAQKVEHYEIATYGTLCAIAKGLGHDKAASLLHKTLEEEKAADRKLTELAETRINTDALKKAA